MPWQKNDQHDKQKLVRRNAQQIPEKLVGVARTPASKHDAGPDANVLIVPQHLVEHYGMRKTAARRVAKAALDICAKRWKRATVLISDEEAEDAPFFVQIAYESKVSRHDVDMQAWNDSGAALKAEIHDYLFIRACEDAGVRLPAFPTVAATADPMQELSARWMSATLTGEYHRLASKAAWHAALLAGFRYFDRMVTERSVPATVRAAFGKALSASLENFVAQIPDLEQKRARLEFDLGTEVANAITMQDDAMAELTTKALALAAFSRSVQSFARIYISVLQQG